MTGDSPDLDHQRLAWRQVGQRDAGGGEGCGLDLGLPRRP